MSCECAAPRGAQKHDASDRASMDLPGTSLSQREVVSDVRTHRVMRTAGAGKSSAARARRAGSLSRGPECVVGLTARRRRSSRDARAMCGKGGGARPRSLVLSREQNPMPTRPDAALFLRLITATSARAVSQRMPRPHTNPKTRPFDFPNQPYTARRVCSQTPPCLVLCRERAT
mgnify:CR=1 FL=1